MRPNRISYKHAECIWRTIVELNDRKARPLPLPKIDLKQIFAGRLSMVVDDLVLIINRAIAEVDAET